ncbi:CLUMA_CG017834, isoform A [Clunio marinus]|uniref:CLUMA_CG017834, isoform A n=1 Tax=Clunio marinus TaxID=568069 RepID=A0A1J1J030_9DIPT|nr:CLUMA_CG017834, isoform A [Clunio marinus]
MLAYNKSAQKLLFTPIAQGRFKIFIEKIFHKRHNFHDITKESHPNSSLVSTMHINADFFSKMKYVGLKIELSLHVNNHHHTEHTTYFISDCVEDLLTFTHFPPSHMNERESGKCFWYECVETHTQSLEHMRARVVPKHSVKKTNNKSAISSSKLQLTGLHLKRNNKKRQEQIV